MITDWNYYKKVIKRLLILIFTLLIIYIVFKLSMFYIPFLIAFIISLIIEPLIRKVMKYTNLTRKVSAIITLIIVFTIIILFFIWGITSLITEASIILENINNSMEEISKEINNLIYDLNLDNLKIPQQVKNLIENSFKKLIGEGTNIVQDLLTRTVNIVTNIPKIMICIGITIIATYFVCTDRMYILDQLEHHLTRKWVNKFGIKLRKIISSLGSYLKAEGILIIISLSIIVTGLLIFTFIGLNVKYPLVIGLIIAFVDALPILGAGAIIVPWAVISAFNGDISLAISLIILYVVIVVTRQLIEPKIISSHIGIHPIFTLIAMYTGFKTIGFIGMFLGPIILIILKNIFETMIENGVVKSLLERK